MSSSVRSLPDGHNRLLRNLGIANKDVESVYNPKGGGWCGYNTVAYMVLKNKRMSDVAGRVVRHALFEELKKRSSEWIAFFGEEVYHELEGRLGMVPDRSQSWWFTTDMLWLVSIVYSFSLTYHCEREQDYHMRGTLLVSHPWLYATCPVILFNVDGHIHGYSFTSSTVIKVLHEKEKQQRFNEIF
ncbi:hypothetical protein EDC94DRAFT_591417, partial [Helicostylum pulchrum]